MTKQTNLLVSLLTVALLMPASPEVAVAQETTLYACYVPEVGAVYRIKADGLPAGCFEPVHIEFSWTAGGAIRADGVTNTENGFAVTGALGTGSIPATGGGGRLMWYPGKAAFRVGSVDGTQWDDASIGEFSTAVGGNTTASGRLSTAMGGGVTASGEASVAMGWGTEASGGNSTAIGSGVLASGQSSIAIGSDLLADGDLSTAMGYGASTNSQEGAFVYGDHSTGVPPFYAPAPNSFTVRASGGTTFYSSSDLSTGVYLAAGAGAWSDLSDRDRKRDFRDVDGEGVLGSIAGMPIQSWSYRAQDPSIRHLGPVAQDFYAAFGLGESDLTITTSDISGVNMLAIQALEKRTRTLEAENDALRDRLSQIEAMLLTLSEARR